MGRLRHQGQSKYTTGLCFEKSAPRYGTHHPCPWYLLLLQTFAKVSRIQSMNATPPSCSCLGLSLLHRCVWVHGDVSANNILLHDGVTKLSDLEFAKPHDESREHDRFVSLCSVSGRPVAHGSAGDVAVHACGSQGSSVSLRLLSLV